MKEKAATTADDDKVVDEIDQERTEHAGEMLKLLRKATNLRGLSWKVLRDVGRR